MNIEIVLKEPHPNSFSAPNQMNTTPTATRSNGTPWRLIQAVRR